MKKIILSTILFIAAVFSSNVFAQALFVEGRDYKVLEQSLPLQKTGEKEVVEFFSFACPHCASLHPVLTNWVKNSKPVDTTFYPMPATGGMWAFVAQVKFTADKLSAGDDFDQAYFDAIHKDNQRKYLGDKDAAFTLIQKYTNVGEEQIEKAWNSLAVKNNMRKSADLWQKSGLTGVPVVIVNGKYVVSLSAKGADHMLNVINYLLAITKP
ncbi:MAG: thiol:disulfide interchange protein DsbA/DsbL [Gammaproteobacteria bacterium]|nr:thiol:disulfide interchange protein DsbA/DsbL [Gammaproteobacteria bacterium]